MTRWNEDELLVLLAFYFRYPRSSHTDSHADCRRLARALRRTPGAVDNQLRNVDFDLVRHTSDRHVSQLLEQLLDRHKDNLSDLYREVNRILRQRRLGFPRF